MIKAEWGTKRSCPKCAARFYDMTKDNPVTCIECEHEWIGDEFAKIKQNIALGQAAAQAAGAGAVAETDDLAVDSDLDIDVDESENSPDNEVDLNDGNDIGVIASSDDDKEDS